MHSSKVYISSALKAHRQSYDLHGYGFVQRDQIIFYNKNFEGPPLADIRDRIKAQLLNLKIKVKDKNLEKWISRENKLNVPAWIIKDKGIFDDILASYEKHGLNPINQSGFYFNDLIYNNDHLPDEIPPTIKREGNSRSNGTSSPPDNYRPSSFNKKKGKVGIGVIDFGFYDQHGNFIKQIIDNITKKNKRIQVVDYNLAPYPELASIFTLCGQIEKGIAEEIHILNISLGYYSEHRKPNTLLADTIKTAHENNVRVVSSAGNAGLNVDHHWHWPSNLTKNVISVGSYQYVSEKSRVLGKCKTDYTNYGNSVKAYDIGCFEIDATAFIHSPPYDFLIDSGQVINPAADHIHGTSFSAASVSAKIALLLLKRQSNHNLSLSQIITLLKNNYDIEKTL